MQDYLQQPPKHHRAPLIIILVCVIVVTATFSIYGFGYGITDFISSPSTPNQVVSPEKIVTYPSSPILTVDQNKAEIIKRLQNISVQPLSANERSAIINFVSRGGATYTDQEKSFISGILLKAK